jgi:hypothetical protein
MNINIFRKKYTIEIKIDIPKEFFHIKNKKTFKYKKVKNHHRLLLNKNTDMDIDIDMKMNVNMEMDIDI